MIGWLAAHANIYIYWVQPKKQLNGSTYMSKYVNTCQTGGCFGFTRQFVATMFVWICLEMGYTPNYSHKK